ncbi:hypothetical protein D3C73_1622700 [compost metagenome]
MIEHIVEFKIIMNQPVIAGRDRHASEVVSKQAQLCDCCSFLRKLPEYCPDPFQHILVRPSACLRRSIFAG